MTDERFIKAMESAAKFRLADSIPEAFCHAAELANEADAIFAEIDRLRERIEQLEYMEARSAAKARAERERAKFWKAETEKRAALLKRLEVIVNDADGYTFCPDCDSPERHYSECELFPLMTMPEEPKP